MTPELKALGCLLLYPDENLIESLGEIQNYIERSSLISEKWKTALSVLKRSMQEVPLSDLQKQYVATFDIGKRASLNLFEHMHGDSRDRGAAMLNLRRLYSDHGLEVSSNEMPDFLPMLLEFLSGLSSEDAMVYLKSAAKHIVKIDKQLQREESPWEAVTGALLSLAGEEPDGAEMTREDLLPSLEAESFDQPVKFGSSADPVQQGVHFRK